MKKNLKMFAASVFAAGMSLPLAAQTNPKPNIIPAVRHWEGGTGTCQFSKSQIAISGNFQQKELFLDLFQTDWKNLTGHSLSFTTKRGNQAQVVFKIDPSLSKLGEEGYRIEITDKILVRAPKGQGLKLAGRTILQLLSQDNGHDELPCGIIEDAPSYGKRMLMLDVGRKFFPLSELKDYIKAMAWLKMNELQLHLSDNSWGGYGAYRLESKIYPDLPAKDGFYTWKEIRELQDFAAAYGIIITPEIDSPGHSLAFTTIRPDLRNPLLNEKYLDVLNPDTYRFIEALLDEVIPHFDAPDFHIGTDEYRLHVIKDKAKKEELGEAFRKYINHFNNYIREKGKNVRIWSGYEHMPGTTEPDKNVIIDMWETSDAQNKSDNGYKFINSSHYYTYIVPGAPYYGVDDRFVYEEWTPLIFSNKKEQNLKPGSAGLLGSKMHIWNDFGPTGYTLNEIARLSLPSMMAFSEKMWGTKDSPSLKEFKVRRKQLMQIPSTSFTDRGVDNTKPVVKSKKTLKVTPEGKGQKLAGNHVQNLEYPWTLSVKVLREKDTEGNEQFLGSDLASFFLDLTHTFKNKKKKTEETRRGVGCVRANQAQKETPLKAHRPDIMIFDYQVPLGKWTTLTLVGDRKYTALYANGKLVGSYPIQMVCPLQKVGHYKEQGFQGKINFVEVLPFIPEEFKK